MTAGDVVDASAMLEFLLRSAIGRRLEDRLLAPAAFIHAPHLIDVEIAQTLRRIVAARGISAVRAQEALDDLASLPIRRYPHLPLMARIWALRANLSAYDAAYVALAEALDATLLTHDRRAATAPGHSARIEIV